MSDQSTTDPILGSRLYDLLRTCIPGTEPLTEEMRRSRLRVCLRSLWYCGRAYNQLETPEPLPLYVRLVFADPEMTHRIQAEQDLAARVIGRWFGALVAKKLSADITLRCVRISNEILGCLSAILGTDSPAPSNSRASFRSCWLLIHWSVIQYCPICSNRRSAYTLRPSSPRSKPTCPYLNLHSSTKYIPRFPTGSKTSSSRYHIGFHQVHRIHQGGLWHILSLNLHRRRGVIFLMGRTVAAIA
ncbi:hypothetical protein EDB84DRAFT_113632 [Lactarius hengduanensis]|nr:hypothetical protein EDB84DRAFT_113632 [Lactarius hengduanensis]